MDDIWRQVISVDDDNGPAPQKIPVPGKITSPHLEDDNSWIWEVIICPTLSNHLHKTNAVFYNCSRQEVMKTTKLELFLILFPVDYQNIQSSPKQIIFRNIQWTLKNLFGGCDVGSTWVSG